MENIFHGASIRYLKRDLIVRFAFLLSLFLLLLAVSYWFSSRAIATKEYDSILLNIAGRQRMLIRQYSSEVNQVLVALASSDMKGILLNKKNVDKTAKSFEKTHYAFLHGGGMLTEIYDLVHVNESPLDISDDVMSIPPLGNEKIVRHLKHVDKEWHELKRIALLSLRSNSHSVSENRYVRRLFDQSTKTVIEMDHVVSLMQRDSEEKLRQLDTILLIMIIIGIVLFFLILYFVYSKIVKPLDHSVGVLQHTTDTLELEKIRAEKSNQAKSEFLSRMSHELRTPMNAILGFAQILELDADDFNETQKDNVKEILEAGYHLLYLINEVLDLAKIESGKLEVLLENVHLDDLLKQCIALIEPQAKSRQIELIDQLSSKGYIVQADSTRLKQVLLNLLSNAVKYNREQGSVTLLSKIVNNQCLRICVTDTGNGLTAKEISRLFTSFERLDAENNVEGAGIGLVITKHLVELMGGTVGVESVPGEGSTFWLELQMEEKLDSI